MPSIYDQVAIDQNYLQQFATAKNPMEFLTGEYSIGAQQQQASYDRIKEIANLSQKQWQEAKDKLIAVNPALDPQKYYLPADVIYDPGEGASSNRNAPVLSLQLQIQLQNNAIKAAEAAAKQYQQTGQIPPSPSPQQLFSQAGLDPTKISSPTLKTRVDNFLQGKGLTEADMASSNAAAARVGAPLPYPTAAIGQISPGGLFTNEQIQTAQAAGQTYDQIAEQARQGSFNYQPSQSFNQGGTGVTGAPAQGTANITPDPNNPGAYFFQGRSYRDLASAQAAAQRAGVTGIVGNGQGANGQPTSGQAGGAAGTPNASIQNALDIINNSDLDPGQKMLFTEVVKNWDPNSEINVPNIITKFDEIRKTTIDPYFQEQSKIFIDQVSSAYKTMQQARGLEVEQEKTVADQNIRNTQADLEARGMTFSGEGVRQLGAQSAYARPGTNFTSATPIQQELPGGGYAEGLIPQQNRIMSSSSAARYQKTLQDLQRQAETTLGTAKSQGLVPGVTPLGGIVQSAQLPGQKAQAEASTLSSLYNQAQQNWQQSQPLQPFNQ